MEGADRPGSGRERRRYVRQPIRLEGQIALGPRPPIACVVKDFCVAGAFIQIETRQLRYMQPRIPATLHFSLGGEGEPRSYQMELEVCRFSANGLGVAFRNPDPKTVALLHQHAQQESGRAAADTAAALSDTHRRFVPEFGRILPKLTEVVERAARQIADEFTRGAADALFIAARDARSNREQALFVDAQSQFRRRTPDILAQVPAHLACAVAVLDNPLQGATAATVADSSGLSLVDKNEFEEFLSISELVTELEGRLKESLSNLNRRLSFMARREIEDSNNPIGPTVVCNVFAESMKGFLFELAVNGVVHEALRRALDANLPRLFDEVNALLVEQNILPVIEREKFGVRKTAKTARQQTVPPQPLEASLPATVPPYLAESEPLLSRTSQGAGWQQTMSRGRTRGAAGMPRSGSPVSFDPPGRSVPPTGYGSDGAAGWAARTAGFRVPASNGFGVEPGRGGSAGTAGGPAYGAPGGQGRLAGGAAGASGAGGASAPATGGVAAGPAEIGLEATFGGYGFGPAVGSGPGFERALSVAQNQLALRRQLLPPGASEFPSDPGLAYSATQVLEGLTALQPSLTETAEPALLAADDVRRQVTDALRARGIRGKAIGRAESDVIEIIVNLFESLLQDARLGEFAKGNLRRLQGSVHRAAQIDVEFMASTHHPLRQLLNRVSMLNPVQGEKGQQLQSRLREMLEGLNLDYDRDPSVVQPLLDELDSVLREQRDGYESNLRQMVNGCEEQQRFLRERRERAGEAPPPPPTFPAELSRWIGRSKGLRVGDRLLMNANTRNPYPVTLAWIGDDFNPYVFADARGMKSASLTLQQVAMYLRRGLVRVLMDDGDSAVDRALFGVVNRLHEQVVDQAAHDLLTGLPTRKAFLQAVEAQFDQGHAADPGAVLCEVSVDNLKSVNDQFGTLTGDQMIKRIGEELRAHCDTKLVKLGRLGGSELGIFWTRGGLQHAYRETQTLLEKLRGIELPTAPGTAPRLAAGLVAVDGEPAQIDPLMTAVHEACGFARAQPDLPIYVAGTDTRQRKQLKQMQSYVAKAIERGRLALLFHEIRSLSSGTPPAARLVVSAEDRNGKLVPPALFSQAATCSAHAWDVDRWTLQNALRWMASHAEESERFSAFVIPLSRAALEREDLAALIVNELMATAVPPARVCFELEDHAALAKLAETTDLINILREFGCQFILAEFGGVQGNYEYLKELAVSFVGIQSSAIADARQDPKDHAIAKSINELAHFMGKLTIGRVQGEAGGVDLLRELKVDFVHDAARATRLILESDERQA